MENLLELLEDALNAVHDAEMALHNTENTNLTVRGAMEIIEDVKSRISEIEE